MSRLCDDYRMRRITDINIPVIREGNEMRRILIFGNSGSGKSTLAKRLATHANLSHLDLDTLAWQPESPPRRTPLAKSKQAMAKFTGQYQSWVIEGCYADLLEVLLEQCNELIYLNLPIEQCVDNARARPWEPHKYSSKAAQDDNLDMLVDWIRQYEERQDAFSAMAHKALFSTATPANKTMISSNMQAQTYY